MAGTMPLMSPTPPRMSLATACLDCQNGDRPLTAYHDPHACERKCVYRRERLSR
jgi:hypothetical protein